MKTEWIFSADTSSGVATFSWSFLSSSLSLPMSMFYVVVVCVFVVVVAVRGIVTIVVGVAVVARYTRGNRWLSHKHGHERTHA